MNKADVFPSNNDRNAAENGLRDRYTSSNNLSLQDVLNTPITLDSYPWETNKYSSTPLGWQDITNNGYYFPALRYMRKQIEANAVGNGDTKQFVTAALEECNHAHAQVCAYSETSMRTFRETSSPDEMIDEMTYDMIQSARKGSISIAQSGLLLLTYPKRLGSLDAARHTAGFHKAGLEPFYEFVNKGLEELRQCIDESSAPIHLELVEPDLQDVHYKGSHADALLGIRVEKHPLVDVQKRTIARMTGALTEDGEVTTLELVSKRSIIAKQYENLLNEGMSPDILGSVYWRDARTKKLLATE
jgi:hypothetical protein